MIVEHAGQAVFLEIGFAGYGVEADLVRFEDGTEAIVILLGDGIVLVVVALGAVHGETHESLGGVLNGGIQPSGAVEKVVVAGEEARGPEGLRVVWGQFVGGQHFLNHAVEALVGVERLHDPVAPTPNVLLAVAELLAKAVPVGVAPDVHPVPGPPFTVLGIAEKFVHDGLPRSGVLQLFAGGRKADEVEIESPNEYGAFRRGLGLQSECRLILFQQGIDWVARIVRQRREVRYLKGPVPARGLWDGFVGRSLCSVVNPASQEGDFFGLQGSSFLWRGHAVFAPVCDPLDKVAFRSFSGNDDLPL